MKKLYSPLRCGPLRHRMLVCMPAPLVSKGLEVFFSLTSASAFARIAYVKKTLCRVVELL